MVLHGLPRRLDPLSLSAGEPLQHSGLRRIRVGNYRVIYEVQKDVLVILVLRVGHRHDIYR
ncbi:MAG: type II toxin-antitoxin system RelE/ParE family toxin [Deltaproteobacteria bacterium]|nr:type II toxin-antitoxin system RelE/ParE family toxin [Deltaproteobacteria bacterium]